MIVSRVHRHGSDPVSVCPVLGLPPHLLGIIIWDIEKILNLNHESFGTVEVDVDDASYA